MENEKYVAVIEVELPVDTDEKAIKVATLFCKKLGWGTPKVSEIYKEENQERRLIYNE
jgi:hypothetical protein